VQRREDSDTRSLQTDRILIAMVKYVSILLHSTKLYYAVIEPAATLLGNGLILADLQRYRCGVAAGCALLKDAVFQLVPVAFGLGAVVVRVVALDAEEIASGCLRIDDAHVDPVLRASRLLVDLPARLMQ
jgi:hypothetical protein